MYSARHVRRVLSIACCIQTMLMTLHKFKSVRTEL